MATSVDPRYAKLWWGLDLAPAVAVPSLRIPVWQCVHLGVEVGRQRCPSCRGHVEVKIHQCARHGTCTQGKRLDGHACCAGCPDAETATFPLRFDEKNLCPDVPGKRFNSSLIEYEGAYLLAFRNGWAGSDIYVIRLTRDFKPDGKAVKLNLRHQRANYGREDPRLFWFRGQLHVTYVGVCSLGGLHTNVLYARLDRQFKTEKIYFPHLEKRRGWEKNWQFFDHNGELHCVYTCTPHRVLKLDGEKVELVGKTTVGVPWRGGEMRGGASPVRVGEEWWSFFHDRIEVGGHRIYRTGLYTFATAPPFQMLRMIPQPILVADRSTKPGDQYASVVFTCGAVRVGGDWVLSSGEHDRWTVLHAWNHAELERKLVSV